MKKLVIFDLDGTLLNTIEDISDAFNYALVSNGLRKASIEEIKYFVGSGVDNLVKRAIIKIKSEEEIDNFLGPWRLIVEEDSNVQGWVFGGYVRFDQ